MNANSEDVGAKLRKQRMLRGQSLEAVHQHTRIPKKLLEALEENNEEAFPARVYMRGFLKTYCEFLDLEFDGMWAQLQPPPPPAEKSENEDNKNAKPGRVFLPLTETTLPAIVLIGGIIIIAGATWALKQGPPTDDGRAAPPVIAAPEIPRSPMALTISADRDVIVRLKVDGRSRFEGRMPGNSRQVWEARHSFALRVSEPEALRLVLDGAELRLSEFPADSDGWRRIAPR